MHASSVSPTLRTPPIRSQASRISAEPISLQIRRLKAHQFPHSSTATELLNPSSRSSPSYSYHRLQVVCHGSHSLRPTLPFSFPTGKWEIFGSKFSLRTRESSKLRCGNTSNISSASTEGTLRRWIETVGELLSTAFPLWVALGCLLGLVKPVAFHWVKPKLTIVLLALTMLGMGMTLTFDDLRGALAMPKELMTGFLLQYSVMPLSGYFISRLMGLPSHYAAGLILVSCCPGGTASNIVTYIARGNVALSVLMTAASTFSAVIMTPILTAKLAGQYIAVDAMGLLMSTLQVVLLPVLCGAFLNQYFQGFVRLVSPLMPPVAVGTVAILCGNAIAQSSSAIKMSGQQVVIASCLLHASGFFLGYLFSRVLGVEESSARTISIEVGMQNSVLGVVLASQHFSNPLTAVPCAVSSVVHSIFGSALAGVWRRSVKEAT